MIIVSTQSKVKAPPKNHKSITCFRLLFLAVDHFQFLHHVESGNPDTRQDLNADKNEHAAAYGLDIVTKWYIGDDIGIKFRHGEEHYPLHHFIQDGDDEQLKDEQHKEQMTDIKLCEFPIVKAEDFKVSHIDPWFIDDQAGDNTCHDEGESNANIKKDIKYKAKAV